MMHTPNQRKRVSRAYAFGTMHVNGNVRWAANSKYVYAP